MRELAYKFLALCAIGCLPAIGMAGGFENTVQPFVAKNCTGCHNDRVTKGDLNLKSYTDFKSFEQGRDRWERVLDKMKLGEMPPPPIPRPPSEQMSKVSGWLEAEFERQDKAMKPDPGKITARRLNRYEYNNTIRDLLAVDYKPADEFPVDPYGYGFDNIGEVLTISPALMDKYLAAARKVARLAIQSEPPPKKPLVDHRKNLSNRQVFEWDRKFEWEGDYDIRFAVPYLIEGRTDPCDVFISIDGGSPEKFAVPNDFQSEGRFNDIHRHLTAGTHKIKAWLVRDTPKSIEIAWKKEVERQEKMKNPPPVKEGAEPRPQRKQPPPLTREEVEKKVLETPPFLEFVEVRGPSKPSPAPRPDGFKKVFACGHTLQHTQACLRTNVAQLGKRAWRRPMTSAELNRTVAMVKSAQAKGANIEEAMRVGVTSLLISPHFLFRIEQDPPADTTKTMSRVNDYELASRLSYFLWSTMPDAQLFRLASQGTLHQPEVLRRQMRRMLKDPKADTLVENFGGQWLQVRNMDSIKPDPDKFPVFTEQLRFAMKEETRLFFSNIIRQDRSILEFLNGKYTYANEFLARFYGIPGVSGDEFRKVELDDSPRVGILTHASVLTVASYPTRTSPVVRGKWILENVLNSPPPPPPADVPALDESGVGISGTLRQQMEKHRSNPACSGCHAKMDPLGFGLENFDAIGRYRTHDGKVPIDSSGVLPDGRAFKNPDELVKVLEADKTAFARCVSEKLMTYALGRSLQRYDRPAIKTVVDRLESNEYRFSSLIEAIVESLPFQMQRRELGATK